MGENRTPKLYHERQVRELCAVHALNNLFQGVSPRTAHLTQLIPSLLHAERLFLKQDLDSICTDLSPSEWLNPHRSMLGLGNYDVNVLMKALQAKDCEAEWFDKRKDPKTIELGASVVGFIMNVPSEYKLGFVSLPLQRRHWISIRRAGSDYYSFDSKLKDPVKIGPVRAR